MARFNVLLKFTPDRLLLPW